MTWLGFLLAAVTPVAKKMLVGLGFGFMTYTGVDVAFNRLTTALVNAFSGLSPDIISYCQITGVFDAMGLVIAAYSFKISIGIFSKMQKLA